MLLDAAVFEVQGSVQNEETLKSSHTSFGEEALESLPYLPISPNPIRAPSTPPILADKFIDFRTRSRKRMLLASLAATFSLLAISMIWSVCRASRSREQAVGVTRRRLAGGDGGIDEQCVLEGCLALEAELGIWRPEPPSTSRGDRPWRIAEIVSFLSAAASEYEANQGMQSILGAGPTVGGASNARQTGIGIPAVGWLRTLESGSGEPVLVRHALDLEPSGDSASGTALQVKPRDWIEEKEDTEHAQRGLEECQWSLAAGCSSRIAEPSTAPSSASVHQPLRPIRKTFLSAKNPRNHPYVRLPVVEAGVVPHDFDPSGIFALPPTSSSPGEHFQEMRQFFAQQTLNQQDVDILMDMTTDLANSLWFHSASGGRQLRPIYAVVKLGTIFLAMDYLVSAVELLGGHMKLDLWWEKFVRALDTDYNLPDASDYCRDATKFHTEMANELLAALRTYKKRKRPHFLTLTELKRKLFFSPFSPPLFRDSQWDPWRQDHLLFAEFGYEPQ
ncbi:hypothetical protein EAH_00066740 [Eimeria acervulina]|uniref:Uncharacterized protein n=1 Tax=Eimeria acervulina TaxID=5801 RepID=U6GVE7_EIMAC|nr:hypothetical protein EAH_00066740 [Eimeria acervulina]CDI82509.1 hypothetical protein EAH_00066740 [Eimeria acervulina]